MGCSLSNTRTDMAMRFSECVLDVVFSGAENGTTERASPTLSWQILEIGAFSDADLVPKIMKERAFNQIMYPVHVFNSLKVRMQKRHLRRIRWFA